MKNETKERPRRRHRRRRRPLTIDEAAARMAAISMRALERTCSPEQARAAVQAFAEKVMQLGRERREGRR